MCGIFGIVLKPGSTTTSAETRQWLESLYKLSESRGKESAGLHISTPQSQSASTLKGAIPATEFIRTSQFQLGFQSGVAGAFAGAQTVAPLALIAHSRLVTNGSAEHPQNNQPVRYGNVTMVHNGIIVNVDQLWAAHPSLERSAEVDTQVMAALIASHVQSGATAAQATQIVFQEIAGTASIAWTAQGSNIAVVATNTGDIYYSLDLSHGAMTFASERYILKTALEERGGAGAEIHWLKAGTGLEVDLDTLVVTQFGLMDEPLDFRNMGRIATVADDNYEEIHVGLPSRPAFAPGLADERLIHYDEARIGKLKRCTKCILPETFPFIAYDESGVCNYCRSYKTKYKGMDGEKAKADFIASLEKYRRADGNPDVIVPFSGGRDSSYGLHLIKKEFNLNPITFTYDWGMVTDLARRNIARVCGQLGVQNILVSADIRSKRDNIRKNIAAWLRQPDLGMIPLFMAGDKHFFSLVNQLKRQTGISLDLWSANPLENTDFKSGFCGIAPDFGKTRLDYLSSTRKARLALYYASRFATNPRYLNTSLLDTAGAFFAYYLEPRRDFYFMFDHMVWNERDVDDVLLSQYDWELSPDSPSTWRIGDGTAPFYNYIYMTARGFTEFDTFRSNQIREGMITREEALERVLVENRPRVPSLKWYLETVNLDFNTTISKVNTLDTMGLHRVA